MDMRLIGVFVVLFALTGPLAYADTSVDWSSYIETNPSRHLTKTTGTVKPTPAPVAAKAQKRVAKTKAKSGGKVKARSNRPSRRK